MLGRLSIGINGLAVVLYLRAERGSFAIAGAVAGAMALGTGLGAPVLGRLVDRLGRGVLLPLAAGHAAGLLALVVLARTEVTAAALAAAAAAAGASMPPVSSVLRALYPVLLRDRPELLRPAFALDSVATELLFVLGPLTVAALVAVVAPQAALLLSAGTVVAGTALFLALLPPPAAGDGDSRPTAGRWGALHSPGMRILVATMLPFGMSFGMLEVVLPAFSRAEGRPELAGVLIAVWSVFSAAGGFWFGMRERGRPLPELHLALALAIPVAFLPLALAPSPAWMALLVLPAGLPIAPLIATRNELASVSAPAGAETEAYTWVLTSMVGGIALGAALAGVVVDEAGWRAAALTAAGVASLGAATAVRGRTALRTAAAVG